MNPGRRIWARFPFVRGDDGLTRRQRRQIAAQFAATYANPRWRGAAAETRLTLRKIRTEDAPEG